MDNWCIRNVVSLTVIIVSVLQGKRGTRTHWRCVLGALAKLLDLPAIIYLAVYLCGSSNRYASKPQNAIVTGHAKLCM